VLASNALTLDELVDRLTPDLRSASPAQRLVLVASGDAGGSRQAYDAVRELKSAGIRPAELRRIDAGALADILEGYDAGLQAAGLVDSQDRRWIAAARAAEPPEWLQQFERVVIHAIYDLRECDFALIRNLIEALPDGGTVVLFNATANVKPTQFAEWTWQRFVRDESLADKTFPDFCRASGPASDLLERLFVWDSASPAALPTPRWLRIVHGRGRYSEAEAIGAAIGELLEKGADCNEIAVVVRNIEIYGELIADVFSRYGITHRFETGIPIIRVPFIKYWMALLDLVIGDRSRDSLARVMSSAYFEPRLSLQVDVAQALVDVGYIDRHHLSASLLAARRNSPLTAEFNRIETLLDRLEQADLGPAEFSAQLQPGLNLTDRDRRAWKMLSEELEAIQPLTGPMTFRAFRKIASDIAGLRTLDGFSGRAPTPGIPHVRIMQPSALGTRSYRWVFAPGFADGEIPSRTRPNPLLTDEIIDALNRRSGSKRLLTSHLRGRAEALFLFLVLDSVTERITLTLPGNTLEGEPVFPSIYIEEIRRHFDEPDSLEWNYDGASLRERGDFVRHVGNCWRQELINETQARKLLGDDVVRRALWEKRGTARADLGAGALPVNVIFSPTELNALTVCPFVFLARHRLRLRAVELPDFEVPPAEVGKLAHDILREFYASPIPDSEHAAADRMEDIVRRQLAPIDVNGQGGRLVIDPMLWKIRRPQLVNALMAYVKFAVRDARDGYETLPEYRDRPLPPAPLGAVQLTGRPDHVAVRRFGETVSGIRVDDFKYSAASGAATRRLRESLQVPIYAYLAWKTLDAPEGVNIEGRYLLLRSPSDPVVTHPVDEVYFGELGTRVDQLLHVVRTGKLHPSPLDRQDCASCDYRRLCRFYG
jgi:hypothetical protein